MTNKKYTHQPRPQPMDRGLNGMVRVSEKDRHLVADIIVGYYSRDNFRDSELLAERHGLGAKHPTTTTTLSSNRSDPRNGGGSGGTIHSEPEKEKTNTNVAAPDAARDGLCFSFDDDDDDDDGRREREPSFPLLASPSLDPTTGEGGGGEIMTLTLAEKRRERRRERRHAHQEELRRKEAERQSERRRIRVAKEQRDREVARAVREAEDSERVRLLREAQEAEDAAPVAARLMRTMQRKAAAAVAAASSRAVAAAGVVEGRGGVAVAAEDGPTPQAVVSGILGNDLASSHGQRKKQQQKTYSAPGEADLTHDRRPSEVRFDQETTLGERPDGGDLERRRTSNEGVGGDIEGTIGNFEPRTQYKEVSGKRGRKSHHETASGNSSGSFNNVTSASMGKTRNTVVKSGSSAPATVVTVAGDEEDSTSIKADPHGQPTVATKARKKGRRKPKKREVEEGEDNSWVKATGNQSPEGRTNIERAVASPPLSRARAKAAAAAAASAPAPAADADVAFKDSKGGKPNESLEEKTILTSEVVPAGSGLAAAETAEVSLPPQTAGIAGATNRPRRKPSEERVGEPRAVFTHRASLELFSADAAAAGETAGVSVTQRGTAGDGGGGSHQRRMSSKGRVGSVLPT